MEAKKKLLLVALSFGAFVIIIVIISIIFASSNSNYNPEDDVSMIDTTAPTVDFQNRYQLEFSVGQHAAANAFDILQTHLFEQDDSNSHFLDAVLHEDTFRTLPHQPDFSYTFALSLNTGQTYQAYVRVDDTFGQEYLIVALRRTDTSAADRATIVCLSCSTDTQDSLANWIKYDLGLSDAIITIKTQLSQ